MAKFSLFIKILLKKKELVCYIGHYLLLKKKQRKKVKKEKVNNNKIPFGGILVALTWGLGHWVSKGSLATGLYTAVGGFVFGSAYLLTNRNVKLSYILLCIMFIL